MSLSRESEPIIEIEELLNAAQERHRRQALLTQSSAILAFATGRGLESPIDTTVEAVQTTRLPSNPVDEVKDKHAYIELDEEAQGSPPAKTRRRSGNISDTPMLYDDDEVVSARTERAAVDPIGRYLREIGRYPLIDAATERALSARVQLGLKAKEELIANPGCSTTKKHQLEQAVADGHIAKTDFMNANLRLVVSIARRFNRRQGAGLDLLDLIQEGNLGLEHAVEKFDGNMGFKFSTYGTWWIKQAISRAIGNKQDTIRLPVHIQADLSQMEKLERQGSTDEEIMALMSVGADKLKKLREAKMVQPISLDKPFDQGARVETSLNDTISDPKSLETYENVLEQLDIKKMYSALSTIISERAANIVLMRSGVIGDEPASLNHLGQKFGLSRERVRQIENDAFTKLKHPAFYEQLLRALPMDSDTYAWKADANCRGHAPEDIFAPPFPRGRPPSSPQKQAERNAKIAAQQQKTELCDTCPVFAQCEQLASDLRPGTGLWAGRIVSSREPFRPS